MIAARSAVVLLLLNVVSSARRPVRAQGARDGAPADPIWVLAPRYHSRGDATLLGAVFTPRWAAAEQFTIDLHSGEWALAVMTGPRLRVAASGVDVLGGPVISGGQWFAGVFIAPSVARWGVGLSGTLEMFFPVTPGAVFGYEISHTRLLAGSPEGVRAGAFFHLVKNAGAPAEVELGPSVRIATTQRLTVTADGGWGVRTVRNEVVLSAQWEP